MSLTANLGHPDHDFTQVINCVVRIRLPVNVRAALNDDGLHRSDIQHLHHYYWGSSKGRSKVTTPYRHLEHTCA